MLENPFDEEEKEDEKFFADKLKKKNGKEDEEEGGKDKEKEKEKIILSKDDSFKEEDDDENQENGIIQKKLKILVINGKESGENGENWTEAKALIENGTDNKACFGFGYWRKAVHGYEDAWGPNVVWKEENKRWHGSPLCYGKNGSAVEQLAPENAHVIDKYAADANVVVLLNSDEFDKKVLEGKRLNEMFKYKRVISYGNGNKVLDDKYWKGKDSAKCVHLESKEGCKNLLECIQQRVDTNPNSDFVGSKIELKTKEIKNYEKDKKVEEGLIIKKLDIKELDIKEFKGNEIEVLSNFGGEKEQKRLFDKVKKYAKKYPKSTVAGGVAGAGIIEELVGQLGFGKSILGTIFGYNSNPKEKDAKNVKDNKKDEKKSDKKVNNSGNQVK